MIGGIRVACALFLAPVAPSVAQDGQSAGRIAATFYQVRRADAQWSKEHATLPDNPRGGFRADPEAPIRIEADSLVEASDGAKQAMFRGNVKLQQGDFLLRTAALTAFYLGLTSRNNGGEWRGEQLTRAEAREQVLVKSTDGLTATGDWANVDVMANTVLMGDRVVVSRSRDVAQGAPGARLKIDLTTGMYRFEIDSAPAQGPNAQVRPQ
jgi:lipopolysaccharide export system protein LptA